MCKFNSKCRSKRCNGSCKEKIREINKITTIDADDIPQGPVGPALIPEETNKVFTI